MRIAERYVIDALLGVGSAGTVYRVRDEELGELVALKLFAPTKDPDAIERVRREVRLARQVTHRNVARTYDLGDHEGAKFVTLEYVRGSSLRRALADGPVAFPEAIAIARAACAGLAAIHEAAIVHRDLKPENVLLGDNGAVKLTDFGIAAPASTHGRVTGTPGYMAPEQLAGHAIDTRADTYALGVVLFELFAGVRPWDGPVAPAVLPRLAELARVPDALDAIVARCLARAATDRPATVAEIADVVEAMPSDLAVAQSRRVLSPARDDRTSASPFGDAASVGKAEAFDRPSADPAGLGRAEAFDRPSADPAGLGRAEAFDRHFASPLGGTARVGRAEAFDGHSTPFHRAARLGNAAAFAPRATTVAVAVWTGRDRAESALARVLGGELVRELAAFASLHVRAVAIERTTDGVVHDARAAEVDVIVDGDVRRTGDTLDLAVRLLSARDGLLLWARTLVTTPAELLDEIAELARAVSRVLAAGSEPPRPHVARDPAAIELYLQALAAGQQSFAELSQEPLHLIERALELAPDDPLLLAAFCELWSRSVSAGPELARRAMAAGERAIQLAPENTTTHAALAGTLFVQSDLVGAMHSLRRALELAPASVQSLSMAGTILCEIGRVDEGLAQLRAAHRLDPLFTIARVALARVLELSGQHAEADRLMPDPPVPVAGRFDWMHWMWRTRTALHRRDPAYTAELSRILGAPAFANRPLVASLRRLFLSGATSRDVVDPIVQLVAMQTHARAKSWLMQLVVEASVALGGLVEAERHLDVAERTTGMVDMLWLEHAHALDPLRHRPGFAAIRDRMHAHHAAVAAEILTIVPPPSR